jgi:hypothetical protein
MLGPDACVMLEGARSKSFEDLEFQEQELKTLSSYSLKKGKYFLDHTFVLIITINITFFYMHACVLSLMDPN